MGWAPSFHVRLPRRWTEGISRIVAGLELGQDDGVLTTTHECFSVLSNHNLVKNRYGLAVRMITPPSGPEVREEEIVEPFEAAIIPRAKVMSFAAGSLFTGTTIPIRRLCTLAQRHGLSTVVDGVLLPGMLVCNLRTLGVDFLVGSGVK